MEQVLNHECPAQIQIEEGPYVAAIEPVMYHATPKRVEIVTFGTLPENVTIDLFAASRFFKQSGAKLPDASDVMRLLMAAYGASVQGDENDSVWDFLARRIHRGGLYISDHIGTVEDRSSSYSQTFGVAEKRLAYMRTASGDLYTGPENPFTSVSKIVGPGGASILHVPRRIDLLDAEAPNASYLRMRILGNDYRISEMEKMLKTLSSRDEARFEIRLPDELHRQDHIHLPLQFRHYGLDAERGSRYVRNIIGVRIKETV